MQQPEKVRSAFAGRFNRRREELGYSLREVARGTQISLPTILRYSKGDSMPDGGWRARALADFLRVTYLWLLTGETE